MLGVEKIAVGLYAIGAATVASIGWIDASVALPVLGVPVTVVGAAALGMVASLATGDPVPTRRELFGQSLLSLIIGCSLAALLPLAFAESASWKWIANPSAQGPIAGISAYVARHILPAILDRVKDIIRNFKVSFRRSKDPDAGG